ncbi:Isocitrate lyase/phosphorylmutase [Apiospora phragmitis]|uniref:Isocitrate lyase/phosphorylmutase n=1 Tax=Apiospora phragmitis TaxID=2905665 RepID=A0ABR1TAG5_9PEZI
MAPSMEFEPVSMIEPEAPVVLKAAPEVELHHIAEPVKPFSLVNAEEVVEEESYAVQLPPSQSPGAASPAESWLPLNHVMASVNKPSSGATKLRKMIFDTKELIVCPGVYDGLSARTAIEVGFDAMYMTGAGTTASRLGQPDLAIAQLHEMRENAEMIANLDPFGPPLIADMDTGYGAPFIVPQPCLEETLLLPIQSVRPALPDDFSTHLFSHDTLLTHVWPTGPIMAARTVEQYIRAGVAGAHLEDQVLTKRCGHLSGKKVVPARRSDFVLIARTDALQQLGYDECIARLREARDEGADVGLLEGFETREQAQRAVRDLAPWPLLLNSVENGKSPTITVDEARAMGFRIMIFSFATLAPAYLAIKETLLRLKNHGIVGTPKNVTPVTLFEVCGLQHSMAVDMNAGGASFKGGV